MARLTMVFGFLLVVLGAAMYVATGSHAPTSLIPAWFGLVLFITGALAKTEDAKKRMLWMHIAVTVGLVGFLGAVVMVAKAYAKAAGGPLARPLATYEQIGMAVLCGIFVALCVRSFIAARRGRVATA